MYHNYDALRTSRLYVFCNPIKCPALQSLRRRALVHRSRCVLPHLSSSALIATSPGLAHVGLLAMRFMFATYICCRPVGPAG